MASLIDWNDLHLLQGPNRSVVGERLHCQRFYTSEEVAFVEFTLGVEEESAEGGGELLALSVACHDQELGALEIEDDRNRLLSLPEPERDIPPEPARPAGRAGRLVEQERPHLGRELLASLLAGGGDGPLEHVGTDGRRLRLFGRPLRQPKHLHLG